MYWITFYNHRLLHSTLVILARCTSNRNGLSGKSAWQDHQCEKGGAGGGRGRFIFSLIGWMAWLTWVWHPTQRAKGRGATVVVPRGCGDGDTGSHAVMDVRRQENRSGFTAVDPVVRNAIGFARDVACLVQDRHRAAAAIFGNLAAHGIDQGRAVLVAVQRNDTTWLDNEAARAELAISDADFGAEIDRADDGVGHSLGHSWRACKRIDRTLVGGAFTGKSGRGESGCCEQRKHSALKGRSGHDRLPNWLVMAAGKPKGWFADTTLIYAATRFTPNRFAALSSCTNGISIRAPRWAA